MARNEHDGRSLEERLASLDAMSDEATGDSPALADSPTLAKDDDQGGEQPPAESENGPPADDSRAADEEARTGEETQTPGENAQDKDDDPEPEPWIASPPSFQQPADTGYSTQTFGPPQPPPYDGGPMPQPFDGGMLPPPYGAGFDPTQTVPSPQPYDANGNAAAPFEQLPPYQGDAQEQGTAGQEYQAIDPATGQPFPQDTDPSGRPYVPIDPETGRPLPQDSNAQGQQYPPADPNAGQPYAYDPNATAQQQIPPADPNAGQAFQNPNAAQDPTAAQDPAAAQNPAAAPAQYQPVDPNTGQPQVYDPNAAGQQQFQPIDPNAGQPYGQNPPAPGQPYAQVDPNTGQPYGYDPNAGQSFAPGQPQAYDPNATAQQQYQPIDPNTGQLVQGYGYPAEQTQQDQSGYPPALNQMLRYPQQEAPQAPPQPPQGQQAPQAPQAPQVPQPAQPPQPPPSADNLSSENLLGERRIPPSSGWRRAIYKATGGTIHPGESQNELRRKDLIARARTVVANGHHRVAVMSLKGGVGKTTTTTGLGSMLASLRGDRVIAVDANPDRGTLSDKVRLETAATVRDLLNNREKIQRYADVRAFTSQNEARLEILASDRDPAVSEAFSADDYAAVAVILEQYYSICITDCGTGLLHSAMAGVLSLADQLILVSSPSVDGARSASATLDWLEAHNHGHLVRNGVVVLSMVRNRTRSQVDLDKLQSHFESRCRAVVRIPYDDHLEEGAEVDLEQLAPATREAYLNLAAVVGDGFAMQRPAPAPGPAPEA